jgi:hypothetical protein
MMPQPVRPLNPIFIAADNGEGACEKSESTTLGKRRLSS